MATKMTPQEAIERLRTLQPQRRVTATAAQIRTIIDDVTEGYNLGDSAARPELADLGAAGILDVVAEFGKHRARVKKRNAPKAQPVAWYESGMLFPPGRTEVLTKQQREAANRKRALTKARNKAEAAGLTFVEPEDTTEETPAVYLPFGYERDAEHRRDIGKSIAAIAVTPVEDEEIIRFVARHYEEQTSLLDSDHVHLLWWVLTEGLTDKLAEIGPTNTTLADLLVQAYDLLDVARVDALTALATITGGERDPQILRATIAQCRWLAPGELDRLSKVLTEAETHPDNPRIAEILATRLRSFTLWVRQNPATFAIRGVAELSEAHLVQILAASGLVDDESAEKEMVAELRSRLTQMGLAADLDREIAEGLRAWKLDRLEEFYVSRQARVDGDPDWAVSYAEALADAETAVREAVAV